MLKIAAIVQKISEFVQVLAETESKNQVNNVIMEDLIEMTENVQHTVKLSTIITNAETEKKMNTNNAINDQIIENLAVDVH
jgi:predicted TIM-barrel fold metal-dependent hydrolase